MCYQGPEEKKPLYCCVGGKEAIWVSPLWTSIARICKSDYVFNFGQWITTILFSKSMSIGDSKPTQVTQEIEEESRPSLPRYGFRAFTRESKSPDRLAVDPFHPWEVLTYVCYWIHYRTGICIKFVTNSRLKNLSFYHNGKSAGTRSHKTM